MYIVLLTTMGGSSCPRSTDVEKLHAVFRFFTLAGVISASWLYRRPPYVLPGIVHWPSSAPTAAVARAEPLAAALGGAGVTFRSGAFSRVQARRSTAAA